MADVPLTDNLIDGYLLRIARDWVAYHSADAAVRDQDETLFNPFGIVGLLVRYDTLHAWDLLQLILAFDTEGKSLDLLSAGPLEDFISAHGADWIEGIEELALADPRFRSLLAGVWQTDTQQDIWDRIVLARRDALPF